MAVATSRLKLENCVAICSIAFPHKASYEAATLQMPHSQPALSSILLTPRELVNFFS